MADKKLIVVLGPTASGKTALAVELARRFGAPVLSADSRQVYRRMKIGTAYPTDEEMAAAPHHMVGVCDPTEEYSAGCYRQDAAAVLGELFKEHDKVVCVGGSGLYINALCGGLDDLPQVDPDLRESLTRRLESEGLGALCADLERLDPEFYAVVDKSNPRRVQRALEVCLQTGKTYSSLRKRDAGADPAGGGLFVPVKVGIRMPREELYARIDARVINMMEAGLEQEARELYPLRDCNALQTVGYRELFEYFDGTVTLRQAVEAIQRNTRRYAKRQITWFLKDKDTAWFAPGQVDEIVEFIESAPGAGQAR